MTILRKSIAAMALVLMTVTGGSVAAFASANSGCGGYCPTTSQPGAHGNEPSSGSVGNADGKNPPGQAPNGSDSNNGYECDGNKGVGQGNPAHTGCSTPTTVTPTTSTTLPGETTTTAPGETTTTTAPPVTVPGTPAIPGSTTTTVNVVGPPSVSPTPPLDVAPAAATRSGTLPFTGHNETIPVAAGLGLIGFGLGLVKLGRKKLYIP